MFRSSYNNLHSTSFLYNIIIINISQALFEHNYYMFLLRNKVQLYFLLGCVKDTVFLFVPFALDK